MNDDTHGEAHARPPAMPAGRAPMHIAEIRLSNFRCFPARSFHFPLGTTYILGPNGSGKTSVLEAAHLGSRLKSFRTANLRDIQGRASQEFGVHLCSGEGEMRAEWKAGRRTLSLDGGNPCGLAEFWGRLSCVPFTSHDLEIIRGGPSHKRSFFNTLLAQTDRATIEPFLRYQELLRQRNAALQAPAPPDPAVLDAITRLLVQVGRPLQQARSRAIRLFSTVAGRIHARIAGRPESLRVVLRPNGWDPQPDAERSAGHSLLGFHRDFIDILVDGRPAARFASEGQQRTAALALRAAEFVVLQKKIGTAPVILADDVFGELDPARREALLPLLSGAGQVLCTCTRLPADAGPGTNVLTLP